MPPAWKHIQNDDNLRIKNDAIGNNTSNNELDVCKMNLIRNRNAYDLDLDRDLDLDLDLDLQNWKTSNVNMPIASVSMIG